MKNKKSIIVSTAAIIAFTGTLSFANEIKTMKKNNEEYIPLEDVVKKANGSITKNKNKIDIEVGNKNIVLQKNNSFAKINDIYYPIQTKEVDGFIVPKDTKTIEQSKKLYIEKDFLKEQKIIDYKIEKNVVIINQSVGKQTTNTDMQREEEEATQTRPDNSDSNTNRPNRPNNSNNNSSNSNTNRPNRPNDSGNNSNNTNRPNNSNNNSSNSNTNRPNRPNDSGNNSNNTNRPNRPNDSGNNSNDTDRPSIPSDSGNSNNNNGNNNNDNSQTTDPVPGSPSGDENSGGELESMNN